MRKKSKHIQALWLPALLIFFLVSCNQSGKKEANQNKVKHIEPNSTAIVSTPSQLNIKLPDFIKKESNATYKVELDKSKLNWRCVTHHGVVLFNNGEMIIKNGEIVNNQFQMVMDSITADDIDYDLMREVLLNTLKSEDFFNTKKFPFSTFSLNYINAISEDSCEVKGNLNIKNITKEITFTTHIQNNDSLLIIESEHFNIDRTKWGITIYSKNFNQTDKSFLFTDMIDIQISMLMKKSNS